MADPRTHEDEFQDVETTFTTAPSQSSARSDRDRLATVMNVTSINTSLVEQAKTEPNKEGGGGRQPAQKPGVSVIGVPVTTTLIRVTLLGVILYQSKFLKLFAGLATLGVFLLTVWLLTRQPVVESTSLTPSNGATTTLFSFEPTGDTTDTANKTLLFVNIDPLSLIGDMTVPNHVLDIESFPD